MKNQWPFWLFLIGIVVVVIISMNYHGGGRMVPLGDDFSGQEQKGFDYEYVSESEAPQATATDSDEQEEIAQPVQEMASPADVEPDQPAVKEEAVKKSSSVVKVYSIQILSSKDSTAVQGALKKAKDRGLAQAYVQSVDLPGKGTWYRLYAGGYATNQEAQQALLTLDKKYYPGAFVVKTGK